jgi:hypothetical protein
MTMIPVSVAENLRVITLKLCIRANLELSLFNLIAN